MKIWIAGLCLVFSSAFAQAQSCNNNSVAASGVGGAAGSAIGAVLFGPPGEVLGGAVGGAVGSVVANGGRAQSSTMLGGAVGGAGGAIFGRGLGGGRLLAVVGAGLGSAGGACVAQNASHHSAKAGHTKRVSAYSATKRAQALLSRS
jgi:hypothetical protein